MPTIPGSITPISDNGGLACITRDIRHVDMCPFVDKGARYRLANATRGTCDECDLAGQSRHASLEKRGSNPSGVTIVRLIATCPDGT